MHLSIIVPAYNEEKTLYKNIKIFNDYLSKQGYDYEIIIVNDGSIDETEKIAKKLAAEINNLKLINNKINKGKGAAVRQGLLEAKGEYRLFIDADNATPINHLEKAWPKFKQGHDIIIGSRSPKDAHGACQAVSQSWWKRLLGTCGNLIIRKLAIKNIWDTQCGFKIFTRKAVENIIPKTTVNRWAVDAEILAIAQLLNYKIAIIPVYWTNSPNSRVGIKEYFSTLKDVFKIKHNLNKAKSKIVNRKPRTF
ncbi:glycosyltransferase family 2 protein [Patescibacteria group bacterium]|nr:glycosyltransferase family 2 protein [Candidatus Falkowbacteria bacterium]MBU3905634.1 glycosyltransferase family 2 protein [Patescibacteria group bacterium]MBU4015504.1 glycosyltransferase family 2 protein [Patescibacteria group bacterium]MBU4026528.1 glycosyltransferase family 2 protein [Patescibacteria group bacterium]MBU4073166.1 glycosyltransferase family 2 protein [Patescibacteria group bacterium]